MPITPLNCTKMELWEALDVDDSDLHPLRPCNHHRCTNQTTSTTATTTTATTTTATTTTATAYTSQSQTLDSSQSLSETTTSLPQNLTSAHQTEEPPQPHTIPGPAGIVQAAKLLKTRDEENRLRQEEHPMATQEYIRKVIEDPSEDDDFKRNPWLSAVEFLCSNGGMFYSALLGEINKCQKNGKLDQVVAVIKSCNPNGLGDMIVALKDPTGTVSGTIHHKILTDGDLRKGICVGSVLILHKVSVFSPSRSIHYLNITKKNLVKVFYKDGGSSQEQAFHETIDAAPHSDYVRETPTLCSAFSLERGTEAITNRMKRSNKDVHNEQENINYSKTSYKDTNMKIAKDEEILKEADAIEKGENVGQLNEGCTNGTKASLGGWTEEQLLELSFWDD